MIAVKAAAEPRSRWMPPAAVAARLEKRPIRYLLAGAWNTLFGVGSSFLLYWLLHDRLHYLVIVVIANALAITMAFATHKTFVYRTVGGFFREYLRFYLVYSVAVLFGLAATPVCMEVLGMNFYVSQLLILSVTIAISYFAHGRFTFARVLRGTISGE